MVERARCPLRTWQGSDPEASGGLLGAVQLVRQAAERAVDGEQLALAAPLRDASVLDDEDLVGAADCREPVRDDYRRATAQEPVERTLDQHLGGPVDVRGRLVQ